jgi:hypothetical protein
MIRSVLAVFAGALALSAAAPAFAQDKPVYRCPGNLYTDQLTPKEADAKGCKTLEGAPVSIVQTAPRKEAPKAAARSESAGRSEAGASRPADTKVDPSEQRARDSDARRILEGELRREEDKLATLQKEYNAGQPERRGDERNFAKYQERVEDMKQAITRKEADIAAIKREIAKLP